jgi:hypothetical protein
MAQTNFTPISLYYSTTAAAVPSAGNLVAGELAINTQDGKLFYKDAAGVVQTIASKDTNSGTFTNISVSGVATFGAGTVSLPSITTTGDTNTGIYFPAADTIAFTEGGVESMRIDSSGNVGIGTSSPVGQLTLNKTSDLNFLQGGYGISWGATSGSSPRIIGSASDAIRFFHGGGSEAMRIASNGDVGIGTSSPTQKLDVTTTTRPQLKVSYNGTSGIFLTDATTSSYKSWQISSSDITGNTLQFTPSTENNGTTFTTPTVTFTSAGNVGIAQTSPSGELHVGNTTGGTGDTIVYIQSPSTDRPNLRLWSGTTNKLELSVGSTAEINSVTSGVPMTFFTENSERMRIDDAGSVLVGTTTYGGVGVGIASPSSGGIYIAGSGTGSTNQIRFANANGVVGSITTSGSLTTYNVSSDRRLKENITPLTTGLASVLALKPSQYNYKADPTTSIQGFIADELQQVVPHAVSGKTNAVDKDGKPVYQGVDASFLIPFLVSAIQELNAKITALENK